MNETCSCSERKEKLWPNTITNKPGLKMLSYRIGTHGSFMETMKESISEFSLDIKEGSASEKVNPLQDLTTRSLDDPLISFLDAWATVADVLTFYQERIANEGYMRTATERQSILELSRLLGYNLRPGVAASVYLAFTLEKGYKVTIPVGTRAQSLPKPGELPQSFETAEELAASSDWNVLRVRRTRPQSIEPDTPIKEIYFGDTATNLKPSDGLLFVFENQQKLHFVEKVEPQIAENRTKVTLQSPQEQPSPVADRRVSEEVFQTIKKFLDRCIELTKAYRVEYQRMADRVSKILIDFKQSLTPGMFFSDLRSAFDCARSKLEKLGVLEGVQYQKLRDLIKALLKKLEDLENSVTKENQSLSRVNLVLKSLRYTPFVKQLPVQRSIPLSQMFLFNSEANAQMRLLMNPALKTTMYKAWSNAQVTPAPAFSVWALRLKAAPFGANASKTPKLTKGNGDIYTVSYEPEWQLDDVDKESSKSPVLTLDGVYDKIVPNSWIAIMTPSETKSLVFGQVQNVETIYRSSYGITSRATKLTLDNKNCCWLPGGTDLGFIRSTTVLAQSEMLELAEEPIGTAENPEDIGGEEIELAELYDGLKPGKILIVSGERTDTPGTSGVQANELVMIADVRQDVQRKDGKELPGDKVHTFLELSPGLIYEYKRETVEIYGNVANATHGQTRTQVLGSGDGNKASQTFALNYSPTTYLPAPTAKGAKSTLQVRVNGILWHEVDCQNSSSPNDHSYVTRTDDEEKTTIIFGDGKNGARLPSGSENLKAVYRTEIGKQGNVDTGQICLLATQPLGVKSVINPQPAKGGADRESRDQARCNAPLTVTSLDRLVSVQDYADFTRTFAGIGKAVSTRLSDGRRQVIHITIVGADDIPIDVKSDLYLNLLQALRQLGDPTQPIQVDTRELLIPIISAGVQILPDYKWDFVEPKVRAKLLDDFGFEKRELGQDLVLSTVISSIQQVPGVAFVDVDGFGAISDRSTNNDDKSTIPTAKEIEETVAAIEGQKPPSRITVNETIIENTSIRAAQIAYLSPDLPQTLILKEITK